MDEHVMKPGTRQQLFNGKVQLMDYPVHADERGALLALEWPDLPITPVRVFAVHAPDGAVRGGHAHHDGAQLLVCTAGTIQVELRYQGVSETIMLDAPGNAVLISAPVWSRQTYHGDDAALLVLSDVPYNPQSFINDDAH